MSDASVEDVIKQIVLANADGEIKSIAVVMINHDGEPELQLALAPNTAYAMYTSLNVIADAVMDRIKSQGRIEPKDRE